MLKGHLICLLAVAILNVPVSAEEKKSPDVKPLRAMLITGGCCHDYETQKKILTEGISSRANVTWTVVHEGGTSSDHKVSVYGKKDWIRDYDVVVHNECFGRVSDVPFVEGMIKAHTDNRIPAVAIHCTMHSYRSADTEEWSRFLGVTTRTHEGHRPVTLKNLKPDHPIMKPFPESWKTPNGELYKIEKFYPTATALAQAYGVDTQKDHICVWVNQYEKTRIFATTIGHHNETIQESTYLDLVSRGLLWACDKLGDDGRPRPGYQGKNK